MTSPDSSGTGASDSDDWSDRRRDAASEHAAHMARAKEAETEQAQVVLEGFVAAARQQGLPTVELKARAHNGRSLYRTGLRGWYLRRSGNLAVDEAGNFYVMSTPTSLTARLRGVTLVPSDPPLIVGVGGRDGESMPLTELTAQRLSTDETWER